VDTGISFTETSTFTFIFIEQPNAKNIYQACIEISKVNVEHTNKKSANGILFVKNLCCSGITRECNHQKKAVRYFLFLNVKLVNSQSFGSL